MHPAEPAFILFALLTPIAAYRIYRYSGQSWLSPVLLCYAAGILWANVPIPNRSESLPETLAAASLLPALPLLLFGADLKGFLKQARPVLLAFGLCVISGMVLTALMSAFFHSRIDAVWTYAGMLTGVYTGGTPNMNLVGMALDAAPESFIYLNGADIICGGLFLLILLSVGGKVYGYFLKASIVDPGEESSVAMGEKKGKIPLKQWLKSGILSLTIAATSVLVLWLLTHKTDQIALLLLILTSLSLAFSFHPKVQAWEASYPLGEYLLLVFSVSIGAMADFGSFQNEGLPVLALTASVLFPAAALHLILGRLFRIDRDTVMITATAAFYGPPFVPQVASALRNPSIIAPGILCGLAGFAIGNYLGISMGAIMRWILTG